MILTLLAAASALAATWTASVPLGQSVDADGDLLVPAGVAVRLEVRPGDALPAVLERPTARDPETSELMVLPGPAHTPTLLGRPEGLLVPLSDQARLLTIDPGSARVRVRMTTRRHQLTSWLTVSRTVDRAWTRGGAPHRSSRRARRRAEQLDALELPWGSAATEATVRLRARAIADRGVRALGTAHDLARLAPLHKTTHARQEVAETLLDADEPWTLELQGPATVVLGVRPRAEGTWARSSLELTLDGQPVALAPLAGTGSAFRVEELFLTAGRHEVVLRVPGVPTQARLDIAMVRQPLIGPRLPERERRAEAPLDDPLAQAELAYLRGQPLRALEGFSALLDQPGARGELARARVLRLTEDLDLLATLAVLSDDLSEDGVSVATEAILRRAADLPDGLVEAAILRAPQPDPAKVADWLDKLGGTRSRGTALLRASRPLVDDKTEVASAEIRHRGAGTRFTRLPPQPTEGAAIDRLELGERGPGVPRVALEAGERASVVLPEWGERSPVLRLRALQPTTWLLDGQTWSAQPGQLGIGLPPGQHQLDVTEGTLYLLDPEVTEDGRVVFERTLQGLPLTWELPDPGARADLRLLVDPPVPVRLRFDDGVVRDLSPDAEGVVHVTAGTWAESLTVESLAEPDTDSVASLEMRVRLPESGAAPPLPIVDVDGALEELRDLSRAIDLGLQDARLARARLLGRMGLLTAARRDLRTLLEGDDPLLATRARRMAGNLAPVTPSAPAPGPTTAAGALARLADPRLPPEGPPDLRAIALEQAAAEHDDDPALWLAAAESWALHPDLARAWAAVEQAGPAGAELREQLLARTTWSWLAYPAGGRGIVRVPRPPRPPRVAPDAPLWRRARSAMLVLPWEDDDLSVIRGDVGEVLQVPAGELVIDVYCRDETGPGTPCRSSLRVDDRRTALEVPDGEVQTLELVAASGHREVELGGPGQSHALALRVRLDGQPLSGSVDVSAHRATGPRPLVYEVGGPLLVRLESLRGEVLITRNGEAQGTVGPGEDPLIVAITEPGPHRIEARGDADLRAWAGVLRATGTDEQGTDQALADELLTLPLAAPPVDVDALFAHLSTPPLAHLRAPGRGGSAEMGLSAHSELLTSPTERWQAGQLFARWIGSGPRHWAQAGGWGRGPGLAGALSAEAGRTWPRAYAGLKVDGGAARAGAGLDGATRLGALLHGRLDPSLGRLLDLRLEGRLRATRLSDAPGDRVDGRIWSQWAYDHPAHVVGLASLVGSPTRDLRWELGMRATSNTGPSLDRFGPFGSLDLYLPTGTVLGLAARAELLLADEHRAEASTGGLVDLSIEHGLWESQRRWWRPWAKAGWRFRQQGVVASAGLRVLLGPRRGLADMPPGSVAFRSLRELP